MSAPDSNSTLERILSKVRHIELKTKRRVDSQLSGDYHSSVRGQGINFHDHRPYQHGDDVRALDWNVTARLNEAHIRTFTEERQRNVLLLVDISGSSDFGSNQHSRREYAAEASAHIAFSALQNKDLVGIGLFSDRVESWVAPQRGRQHGLRLIRDILAHQAESKQSNLRPALENLLSPQVRPALVFILSDFLLPEHNRSLRLASQRHEIICVHLLDPLELKPPALGRIIFEDAETAKAVEIDTSSSKFRRNYQAQIHSWQSKLEQNIRRSGSKYLRLELDQDPGDKLHQFFQTRHHG